MITGVKRHKVDINKQFFGAILSDQAVLPNLLLRHYQDMGLNPKECLALLQVLAACPKGSFCFTLADLTAYLEGDASLAKANLQLLLQKGFLSLQEGETGNDYTLDGLQQKLREIWVFLRSTPKEARQGKSLSSPEISADLAQICRCFEEELGRPLSPMEGEKLSHWLFSDGWQRAMIQEALKRAVIHGNCNFAYIDKILESWRKKGITNMTEAQSEQKRDAPKKKEVKKEKPVSVYDELMNV